MKRNYTVEIIASYGKPKPYCFKYKKILDEETLTQKYCIEKNCSKLVYVKERHIYT
jgi:hypothetical protein